MNYLHPADVTIEERSALLERIATERLERKSGDVESVLRSVGGDWPQAIYIKLLHYVVGGKNAKAAEELARRVPYNVVMRERGTLRGVEALLLGTSGLVESTDLYTRLLMEEYAHLEAKYNIVKMGAEEWQTQRIYPHNHPLLRLAQVASMLHRGTITISNILAVRSDAELRTLLDGAASEYWTDLLGGSEPLAPRMGVARRNIIGINFVAPIIYAYGRSLCRNNYREQSIALLRALPAEDNRYVKEWIASGIVPRCALESQALIELSTSGVTPR